MTPHAKTYSSLMSDSAKAKRRQILMIVGLGLLGLGIGHLLATYVPVALAFIGEYIVWCGTGGCK
jgi:uncharacterized membrane protein